MDFKMFEILFETLFLIGMGSIIFIVLGANGKTMRSKMLFNAIAVLLSLSYLLIFSVGRVDSYSNGIKIEENKMITQFFTYDGENYTSQIRTIGKIVVEKVPASEANELNKRVKVERNLIKGTKIYVTEEYSESLDIE